MSQHCDSCGSELESVVCDRCGGLSADPEGDHAEECDECNGEGGWFVCPDAADGGECENTDKIFEA